MCWWQFGADLEAEVICDICDKSAVFNILRQNETIFDIGNG